MVDLDKVPAKAKEAAFLIITLAIIDLVFDVIFGVKNGFGGVAAGSIILSVIMILCGYGILLGNKIAFIIAAVLAVLSLLSGIIEVAACCGVTINGLTANWVSAILDLIISLCVAYELFQKETRKHCGF